MKANWIIWPLVLTAGIYLIYQPDQIVSPRVRMGYAPMDTPAAPLPPPVLSEVQHSEIGGVAKATAAATPTFRATPTYARVA